MDALDAFLADCRTIFLSPAPLDSRLMGIGERLSHLVRDEAFVSLTFAGDPPAKRLLHRDPQTDIHLLAHVFQPGVGGNPHSHAPSWAIYANARGSTDMREFVRLNPEGEDPAELKVTASYRMNPGDVRAYPSTAIHAPRHEAPACVIRVTGGDLDAMKRWRFRAGHDRIIE